MRETRQAVLEHIKRKGNVTVSEIADLLDISPVTVRHHLYALMADGLVERESLRRGVGRPDHTYSLTGAGQRLFPSRYHVLTTHLINVLKTFRSEEDVRDLLEGIVRQLLLAPGERDGLTPQQRLARLEAHFQANDIPIQIRYVEGSQALLELRCPYYYVSQFHPELCSIDAQVIEEFLHLPMQRTGCLRNGDRSCSFSITLVDEPVVGTPVETGSD